MLNKKTIITISREHGSGGRKIGERIAAELGISFYDKKLINIVAEQSGLSMEFIENHEQKINNSFLFNIAVSGYYSGNIFNKESLLPEDKIFLTQTKIIRDLAEKESCVIVGRCADYILKDREDCFNVFIFSDLESRKKRAVTEYGFNGDTVESELKKADKARNNHYSHYTGQDWGQLKNYHLAVNSDFVGFDNVVDMIVQIAKNR
ncbi:cytidylate kinase-like family protein [Ruminococcaceae bacterium OttesenSCG-928-L11]|nr:cytidylate kinase-like family protein [Ruminococcaceae bacterium OttesenSCG-928-L11]